MQTSSPYTCTPLPGAEAHQSESESRRSEDRLYQAITIAAMLVLLGTLWVF
jgi:hypothetical protein